MVSANTWISVAERPPPVSDPKARRKCWCFFRSELGNDKLGYYAGNGVVHFGGSTGQAQLQFALEKFTLWQPLSERDLEEFENAKRSL